MRTRGLSRLSLRWRLLLGLGLVAAILIGDRVREIATRRAELVAGARAQLMREAEFAAQRQAGIVSDLRALLTVVVEMDEAAPRPGLSCREPFERAVAALPSISALLVVGLDGRPTCGDKPLSTPIHLAEREYFKSAVATRSFVLSDIVTAQHDGQPSLLAAMPRISGGEVESVIVARIDLDWLGSLVAQAADLPDASIILADRSGTIVAAYPDRQTWTGRALAELGLPVAGPEEDKVVHEVVDPKGRAMIYAATRLPLTANRVLVGATRAAVLAPAQRETTLAAAKLGLALLVCAAALWFGAERFVVRPVEALAAVAARLGRGDLSARAEENGLTPEMRDLARAFNLMAGRLAARASELRALNENLARLATLDPLTGLSNRRLFDERLAQEWRRAARTGKPLGLVLVDVDCFKAFNDTYGHPEGDSCLRRVAGVIGGERRPDDLAARVGGEEFALILPDADVHRTSHVARLAKLEVEALAIPHIRNEARIVTISAGAASIRPVEGGSAAELVGLADGALYRAKQGGRNRVAVAPQPTPPVRDGAGRLAS